MYTKGKNWVIYRDVDGTTVLYGVNKSKREKQISESRKMVQMNLAAGQEQRCKCRVRTSGHWVEWGRWGGEAMNWEIRIDVYKPHAVGSCYIVQGTQLSAPW